MTLTITAQEVPLRTDESGTVRLNDSRISLDVLVTYFERGMTAEEIVEQWPYLNIGDIYAVLTFYWRNRTEIAVYLAEQEREAAEIRREIEARQHPDPLRARLHAAARKQQPS
ncbi:MAG: DUF433 domain-containing protein [Chloroflexota bacterium]|nr:DUF433 domain-containing protein [Chloroflexota bacterium]